MLSCGAMQAANAADCSTKKEYLTQAEVSKATGMSFATVQEAGTACVYSTAADKSGMASTVQLSRAAGGSKQGFDGMITAMGQQGKLKCEKVAGIGDDARLCTMAGSPIYATVMALKGAQLYTIILSSPAAMTDKAVAAKLPDGAKALATAMVAK
jgi:hypothetical protein